MLSLLSLAALAFLALANVSLLQDEHLQLALVDVAVAVGVAVLQDGALHGVQVSTVVLLA